jgi:hypothetical protein
MNSRQGAKDAKVFGLRTKKHMKFPAASVPLREIKLLFMNSRQSAKDAKVFGLRTKKHMKFPAVSAPLREKKTNLSRQGAKHAKVLGVINDTTSEILGQLCVFARK